jgi:hypothetical protein
MKWILEYSQIQGGMFHYADPEKPFIKAGDWTRIIHNDNFIIWESGTKEEKLLDKFIRLYNQHTPLNLHLSADEISIFFDYYINCNEVYRFIKKLPNQPGVYFLFNKDCDLIYIGKANDISQRLPQSIREKLNYAPIFYSYAITETQADAVIYEVYYMTESKQPICNSIYYEKTTLKFPELYFTALDYCDNLNKKKPANVNRYNKLIEYDGLKKRSKENINEQMISSIKNNSMNLYF